LELLQNHAGDKLKCVLLSHISKENNTPATALSAMKPLSQEYRIELTSRFEASPVFQL